MVYDGLKEFAFAEEKKKQT